MGICKLCCCFGPNDVFIKSFPLLLTFSTELKIEQFLHLVFIYVPKSERTIDLPAPTVPMVPTALHTVLCFHEFFHLGNILSQKQYGWTNMQTHIEITFIHICSSPRLIHQSWLIHLAMGTETLENMICSTFYFCMEEKFELHTYLCWNWFWAHY